MNESDCFINSCEVSSKYAGLVKLKPAQELGNLPGGLWYTTLTLAPLDGMDTDLKNIYKNFFKHGNHINQYLENCTLMCFGADFMQTLVLASVILSSPKSAFLWSKTSTVKSSLTMHWSPRFSCRAGTWTPNSRLPPKPFGTDDDVRMSYMLVWKLRLQER